MIMRIGKLTVAILGAATSVLLQAACSDDATGPTTLESGSVYFNYSGGIPGLFENGTFSANGAARLDVQGRAEPGEWALAGPHPSEAHVVPRWSKLAVVAFKDDATDALVVITLPGQLQAGTVPIDDECVTVNCSRVVVILGSNPAAPHSGVDGGCELDSGSVIVISVSPNRIQGLFSGHGWCVRDAQTDTPHEIILDSGSFDVPVADQYRSGLEIWS